MYNTQPENEIQVVITVLWRDFIIIIVIIK